MRYNDVQPMWDRAAYHSARAVNRHPLRLLCLLCLALILALGGAPDHGLAAPTVQGGWSPSAIVVAPAGQRFLGSFEAQTATLLVTDLPTHAQITLRFDFYAILSWDGNAGADIGPDIFRVTHSGDQPLLQTTFSNYVDQPQAYPGAYPGASNPGQTGAMAVGSLGYPLDSVYNLSFTFDHTAAVLQVNFTGAGLQPDGDELWGLDNVTVEVDGQAVYTFDAEGDLSGPVVEVAQLVAAEWQSDDTLGTAVAVQDGLLAAGAPAAVADNLLDQNQRAGAVYLFARDAADVYLWEEVQKLTPTDGAPNDRFGWTVALDATLIAVGAPWADVDGKGDQGAVYLFAPSPTEPNRWVPIQKLTAPDGAAGDRFGRALALDGGGMVIGAKEKAYLFYRGGDDQWYLVKTLTASDGKAEDRFGDSVSLDGDMILVGASGAPIGANYLQGATYLYQRDQGGANNWGEVKKLTAPDGDVLTFFGAAVLLANNQAIIGGVGKQQVYIFSRNFGGLDTWAEVQRLTSIDDQPNYSFGARLAQRNQRLVVGAGNQAHLFERANGSDLWLPLRQLQGSAGHAVDFGGGLDIQDNWVFAGTPNASSSGISWHGAVYLFDVTRPSAPTARFALSEYLVQETIGPAVLKVLLDRPSPYPLSVTYETSTFAHEALPVEDYTPVSGTLTIPTGDIKGIFNVWITNDNRLELPERLNVSLGQVAGGLLGEPRQTVMTILDDDTVGACDYVARDEESLDRALRCLYVAEPGAVTIQVTANISLTRPLPLLTSPQVAEVIIEGNGHTIDAQGFGRVLAMYKIKVDMRNLTLRGGRIPLTEAWPNPNYGGGLYADTPNIGFGIEPSCALTLTNVVITDNEAYAGGGLYYGCELPLQMSNSTVSHNRAIFGGAFSTSGGEEFFTNLFIKRSTFSGNVAEKNGGALDLSSGDGGVILELVNSTVSSNRVISGTGGGLWITQASHDGRSETHLINSTVANNAANQGSGVFNRYGTLRLSNSLIADNQGASNCIAFTSEDSNGQMISHGYNLDSDSSCLTTAVRQPSDLSSGAANLGPLADNGGPTLTHALLPGSQAIDAGDDAVCADLLVNGVDQRGVPRFQGAHCDMGAYEVLPPPPANTLRLQALIDGRSQLIVRGNTAQWQHFDFAAPGRHDFANRPTVINDTLWFPVWPDQPDVENRDCNCTSDVFTAAGPLLPTDGTSIGLRLIRSRALVQIVQSPDAGNDYTLIVEFDDNNESGAATYIVDLTWGQPQALLFVSARSSGKAGNVQFRDEDIVAYDFALNSWQMLFDGSDVGVTKDVDAFTFRPDGLLLSFNGPTVVPGAGAIDDSDLLLFTPTRLGHDTAGSFTLYRRGAEVGLTTDGEDIDAIGFTSDGKLVVSTIGDFDALGAQGHDEDLFVWDNGVWQRFFVGANVGLANEDVNGLWIDPATGELYLTVKDEFAFDDVQIDSDDIFVCTPTQGGGCTFRRFWDGDAHDYGSENLDAIGLGALPPTFVADLQSRNDEPLTMEEAAADEESDDLDLDETRNYLFYLPWSASR